MTDFPGLLDQLIKGTKLFPGENLSFYVFYNPLAGIFQSPKRAESLLKGMEEMASHVNKTQKREIRISYNLTKGREETLKTLVYLVKGLKVTPSTPTERHILLLGGGDGFHKDGCTALMQEDSQLLKKVVLFRLPLGTGNDTPFIPQALKALEILSTGGEIIHDSLIRVTPTGLPVDYSINVASFGLDAYVCLLKEKWQRRVKGDIYKVMVDLSTLFYDFYHWTRVSELIITLKGEDKPLVIRQKVLLNVLGRKGYTTYGGGKKILPGEENHMVTGMIHTPGRIWLKGLFMKGLHGKRENKNINFYHTEKFTLNYKHSLLMELDGEITALGKENFPITLEVLPNQLRVLN